MSVVVRRRRLSGIRTRFPPEPNGYLHIGHAKSICLNFGLAERYDGSCNLRFDDTNPAKEDPEFVQAIQDDVRWLGFDWANLRHASDYFDVLYLAAEKLVQQGDAFVCDLSAEMPVSISSKTKACCASSSAPAPAVPSFSERRPNRARS